MEGDLKLSRFEAKPISLTLMAKLPPTRRSERRRYLKASGAILLQIRREGRRSGLRDAHIADVYAGRRYRNHSCLLCIRKAHCSGLKYHLLGLFIFLGTTPNPKKQQCPSSPHRLGSVVKDAIADRLGLNPV